MHTITVMAHDHDSGEKPLLVYSMTFNTCEWEETKGLMADILAMFQAKNFA